MSGSGTGIVTPYNTHRGIDFVGVADLYARGAGLTGDADSQSGYFSAWCRFDGGDGAVQYLMGNQGFRVNFQRIATGEFRAIIRNTLNVNAVVVTSITNTFVAGTGWHHLACSWDTAVPIAHMWVNGALDQNITTLTPGALLDYTRNNWWVGASSGPASLIDGAISELVFQDGEYIDLTVQANRDLHRHPNGQPPNIGADGSLPTGTQPIMYMVEEGGVMVNRGSGGAFVAVGAPALSADSPKDRWVASLNHRRRQRKLSAA